MNCPDNVFDPDFMSTVRLLLTESLFSREGLNVQSITVEKVVRRSFSDVMFLRASATEGERRLVLKRIAHHPANRNITESQNQAVVEYNILETLYPQFQSTKKCRVPRPVIVIPEHEAYVMDYVDGRLLGDLFVAARYFSSKKAFFELMEYYYLCGVWLKKLQQFSGIHHAGKEAFTCLLERCEQKLKLINGAKNSGCPPNFETRVRKLLDEQLNIVNEEDILVTGRHGDFGSWNIMAGPGGITVFDFFGYQNDLLLIDLIKMLVNLENEKSYLFYSTKRIMDLRNNFLDGFGQLPEISQPVKLICELLHRVCNICSCVETIPKNMKCRIERKFRLNMDVEWVLDNNRRTII